MNWKTIGQKAESTEKLPKHRALQELDGVKALIDWARLEAKLSDIHTSERGEQA